MLNIALPSFDLAEGGILLALARSLSVASLLSAFGALLFRCYVAPAALGALPADERRAATRSLFRLSRLSLLCWIVAAAGWLVLETAVLADSEGMAQTFKAIPKVFAVTLFGHLLLLQFLAILLTVALLRGEPGTGRAWLATILAGSALVLQAGHGHALAMYPGPNLLLASDVFHLLAAGAWLGALLPLLDFVRIAPPRPAALAARAFSPLGKACVLGMVVTAGYQGWILAGGVSGLLHSGYGWTALGKLVLFLLLFGFAVANRYRFAPALLGNEPVGARRTLLRSLALQTACGLLVVILSGILISLPPGMHRHATDDAAEASR